MEIVIKTAAILAVGCGLAVLLKQNRSASFALLLSAAVCVTVLMTALKLVGGVTDFAMSLIKLGGLSASAVGVVFKTVGIALITRLTADICKDAGQNAMASCAETVGAISAVYVMLPLMDAVVEMTESML